MEIKIVTLEPCGSFLMKGDIYVDWTNIIVAALAFLGSVYGSYKSKDKIIALLDYRLHELEKKQDKHNNLVVTVYELEKSHKACRELTNEKIKVANHRIDDLEK